MAAVGSLVSLVGWGPSTAGAALHVRLRQLMSGIDLIA